MEILIIIILIVVGLTLFGAEIFLLPGFGIAGILSAVSLLYAVYYAFATLAMSGGFITLFVTLLGIIGIIIWFMRSKTMDRLSLKKELDYTPDPLKDISIHIGDKGIARTRLTLIGNAEINGHILEVQSSDGFIDEKTPIEICRIDRGTIYVRKQNIH